MSRIFASLRIRLLAIIVLLMGPMLALALHTYSEQMRQATSEAHAYALRTAQHAANDQERLIEGARQLLVVLAQLPSVRGQDAAACNPFMVNLLEQYTSYENMGAASLEGEVFCSAFPSPTTLNAADRPWFQQALQARDFVAGDYIIARITGKPTLATAYPVLDEAGQPRAVVFAGIDLSWLDSFVADAQLPAGSSLTVINSAGTILTRYPDPERWRGTTMPESVMEPLLTHKELVNDAQGIDGVQRLYGTTMLCCLPGGDIYVRVGIPAALVYDEANTLLRRNLAALGLVTLLAFVTAWGGARFFLLRPLDALLTAIRRFEAGDAGVRVGPAHGRGELAQLAEAFDQMASTIQARGLERDRSEQALRVQSARAAALATIAAHLGAQLDLQAVLELVCRETTRALQVPAASASLHDDELDTLRVVSHCGLPEDFGEQIEAVGWRPCTRRLDVGETVVVSEVQTNPGQPDVSLFAALDIRTFVSTPMVHEGHLVGVLCVFARGEARHFSEDEIAFLKAIADLAAQSIANARLYEALQEEQRARAALLEKTISAQEDERKRIARELHDQTSQDLAALMLCLDTYAMGPATDQAGLEQPLRAARSIAETMLTNTHRLINDLRPLLLDDLGLAPAIVWYGERRLQPMGITLEFQCDRMESRLPPSVETALFRITQEALTNVVRHADASTVRVTLRVHDHTAFLTVLDNGTGFREPVRRPGDAETQGLGLRGMKERVAILGGELRVESEPGRGTAIAVAVPLPKQENYGA